ncbi:MAG TPA: phosphate regulon sensor histidine kinase PhoR [Burkholderiaceae bacterium]|nr:phosphate regulon sensor histidine kinase PhoR [Burkholderiaceae bacterium]
MSWLWSRLLSALLWLLAGTLCSWLAGYVVGWPWTGLFVGIIVVVTLLFSADAVRAQRLMQWLRSSREMAAPRGKGVWAEFGYRIERALRQLERALEDERGQLRQFLSAIEASPNGVLLLDRADQIEWCSVVAADHLGLDPVGDRRQRVTNLVRAPAFVAYMQAGQFGQPIQVHIPGGRGTLSVSVRPYGDGKKLLLTQDITEGERTEAMRRDFVANVSHEIRTPLTVLSGFVETLSTLPLTEAEHRRVLLLMRQQTDRMQTLVGDLLTLAQLEGSPRPAADLWVPVQSLVQRVEADAASLSAGRHQLNVDAGEPTSIAGNDSELFSALTNLVTNAIRYTPEGGRIDVRWKLRPDGGGEFEVRDTGIGIAKEHLPRLTERFYRVDGSRSRETGGTGLGLSIVKHVVQRHGGELDVQSELGKGSCFRLVLPASRVRRTASEAALSVPTH